jgi:hypothetical protein
MAKRKTGTREWSDSSVNCVRGCKHNCRYCYARATAVSRGVTTDVQWTNTVEIRPNIRPYNGVVMFPTQHDITPEHLPHCLNTITGLLTFGNDVLVVSKPHLDCIKEICRVCESHKDKMMFRFSIGSSSDRILGYWEPNAPCFEERYNSLHYAFRNGFKTSISCEPCLDTSRVCELFFMLKPFITDSFWIGKMNRMVERVVGVDPGEIERINRGQTDDKVMDLYKQLRNEPLIKWKESYSEVLERYGLI